MAMGEYRPTALASIGTITRNPLPKMEASGVLMALMMRGIGQPCGKGV